MRAFPLIVLAVALLIGSRTATAQDSEQNVQRLQLAESFMRSGQYERAVVLLEQLYAADPGSFVTFDRLRTAYENVKRYDDAIAITKHRIEISATPVLYSDVARLMHLKGDEAEAARFWKQAIAVAPTSRSSYHVVYRSMLDVRRLDLAIETLRDARRALSDPTAFRGELAMLLGTVGRLDEAMDENIALLRDDPRQLSAIMTRLGRLTEQREALEAAIQKTSRAVREDPLQRPVRELLSWLYLEAGDYEGAFEESRAIDRLEGQEGRLVLAFAQRAMDAGAFETARDAYEHVRTQHARSPTAVHAQLGLASVEKAVAESLEEDGDASAAGPHYERALSHFESVLAEHPGHPSEPQILKEIGLIEKNVRGRLDEAATAFERLIERYPQASEADEARLERGRIDVMRGDLEAARLHFNRIVERLRIGDIAERARFEIALIHFYRGEFESARAMTDVLDINTSTDVSNDAIELKVVMSENRGPDSLNTPLRAYAESLLLLRQNRADEAVESLGTLLSRHGTHRIADEARFARAEALEARGSAREAFDAFSEVALYHPESHLADRALYRSARIQYRHLDDRQGAIETLTRLLTRYPGSLIAGEVRTLVRRLRGDAL